MRKQSRIVLVTGASRGAGKGIALAFGSEGDIVYVTGRTQSEGAAPLPGTVYATAEEITKRGGQGIAAICDHNDDAQVQALFERIQREQGRLDILVNNATHIHDDLIKPGAFWSKSLELANILNVGLRSSYVASYYAAKIMSENRSGLIVNTGSFGSSCYMHGPAYGAQKAGLDKMAWDMAHDLRPYNVASAAIWMGMLKTERTDAVMAAEPEKYENFFDLAESPEFTGRVISALYESSSLMEKSGYTFVGAELGQELGVKDIDGKQPISHRDMLGSPLSFSAAVVE
ncbi:SDR family NAD(P)-dependent oxidoreductase [Pseudomaricurvus alkylphenolicus]|uniref:SDR family NAD(P)-dependent oxidoreductase n=1 Tax=Pseudomaricurvus alkylphenolicus TaxID=1306991 RepID=UPI001421B962|nr:SDR family NAD(P)-dependent oxidoreductase [Pseudomaricurvus alkylphenolicus]NIB42674.1 SDR family NAD(P)-dependent oxidoreductase [Pseudomaricurvus alkylphenolicus]